MGTIGFKPHGELRTTWRGNKKKGLHTLANYNRCKDDMSWYPRPHCHHCNGSTVMKANLVFI